MLVTIISDVHDNLANLETCLIWCQKNKVKKIICCGDTTNLETINFLAQNFSGEIFIISGNADNYDKEDIQELKNIKHQGEIAIKNIGGLKIAFYHQPEKIKKIKDEQLASLDFAFYGHTHKPWLERKGQTIIANPGTLGGVYYPATFAILNTKTRNLELKILEKL